VKGKAAPIPVYQPCGEGGSRPRFAASQGALIGRAAERARIDQALSSTSTRLLMIEGEAGIGKSRLVEYLMAQAADRYTVLMGWADAIERLTPYHAWQPIFASLLGVDPRGGAEALREQVFARLADRAELLELSPLLNAVLPLDLPDNALTAQMSGEARANKTNDLLLQILEQEIIGRPTLLVIEDAHWLDSASWALLLARSRLPDLRIAVATRPHSPAPPEFEQAIADDGTVHLILTGFDYADMIALVCQRLGVAALPAPVERFLEEVAGGHPFFAEEIGYALRDAGVLEIENGTARLVPADADLRELDFPSSIEGIITSRVDRLSPAQQLTAKVASVIGRVFGYPILSGVYPIEQERATLPAHLDALGDLDIAHRIAIDPELSYAFKHIITQDVVYNMLTFATRRQLHAAIAGWYERHHPGDLDRFYPLLAYHYTRTDNHAAAVQYLDKAGELSMRRGAFREAIQHFTDAQDLVREHSLPVDSLQLAKWERQFGMAYHSTGDINEARGHYVKALAHLSRPLPEARPGLVGGLLAGLSTQGIHRLLPGRTLNKSKSPEADRLASHIYIEIGQLDYYLGRPEYMMYESIHNLNVSEEVGPSPELAAAYVQVGMLCGFIPIHKLAERYIGQAIDMIRQFDLPVEAAHIDEYAATYYVGIARLDEAQAMFARSAAVFEPIGERQLWSECALLEAMTLTRQGRLAEADQRWDTLRAQVQGWGNRQIEDGALLGKAEIAILQGRLDEALSLLAEVEPRLDRFGDGEKIWLYGMRGRALLWQGDLPGAVAAADQASAIIRKAQPAQFYVLEGYASAAEVYLAAFEANPIPDTRQQAEVGLRGLAKYAKVMPLGEPRLSIYRGRFARLTGNPNYARRLWLNAQGQAAKFRMPYEEALAGIELARHTLSGEDQRAALARCADLLSAMGAAWDLSGGLSS
jgi:tetratricopeptide (TPR) repeat protein